VKLEENEPPAERQAAAGAVLSLSLLLLLLH